MWETRKIIKKTKIKLKLKKTLSISGMSECIVMIKRRLYICIFKTVR